MQPVLYLDTLKVSTIEQTAENTEARGGKGNAMLISWDYNKEINVTLEDALFSAKSMAIMFGNGTVKTYNDTNNAHAYIMKTEQFIATNTMTSAAYANAISDYNDSTNHTTGVNALKAIGWKDKYETPNGKETQKINPKFYDATGKEVTNAGITSGEKYFCSYDVTVNGGIIEISANSFPGTYYITGDTFARSETTGKDEFFQFIIPKAKVTSENTITLEAEGDPSVLI